MYRFFMFFFALSAIISCSKDKKEPPPPNVIPGSFDGGVTEFNVTPLDINTPDKGTFLIAVNSTFYKVDFDAVAQSASNAIIKFDTDTILTDQSTEFANLGKDAISYNPVADNLVSIIFSDGRIINGFFTINTSFGGVFGEALISQWRDAGIPTKPNQKAKNDLIKFVQRYADKDGPGPLTTPQYLFVKVSER